MIREQGDKAQLRPRNFADVELADVIDVPALQEMMNDYYALTGIGIGIIDRNGTVLVGTGWQDICVRFHRATPASCTFCHESDVTLSTGVPPGTFREYRCKNNMWDIATPIMLGDRHIGNIFLGQFFYDDEEPDYELFRTQALRFGYDESEYLAALDRVPRWSRETVQTAMGFYSKLARMISTASYSNVILADTLVRHEQAEEALRWMRISVESAADALYWIAPDARIVEVNEAACRSLGYSREELLRLSVPDFDPHYNASIWPQQFATLRQRGSMTFESEHRTKDGRIFPVEIVASHVNFGHEERHCAFVRDITERKRAEEALRESEEKFAKVFSAAPSLLVISTIAEGRYIDVNESFEHFTGYRRDEAIGRTSLELNLWSAAMRVRFLEGISTEGRVRDLEADFRCKDGSHRVGLVSAEVIEIKGEKCLLVLVNDITERKRVEESLWIMNHVFHSSIAANSIAGLDGIITECNDAFLRVWGYRRRDEAIGRAIADFFIDPAEAVAILAALNETGHWEGEFSAKRGDGSIFIAYGMATRVRDKNGTVTGYQSACMDITERKQSEQDLRQAKAAAEAANIAKSQFLATMSHEIRTPMNGVIGMLELLQLSELTPEQHDYAERAKKSGFELVHLLNDVLDLSKIEAEKLELELAGFELIPVIADTLNLLSLASREKGVKLSWTIDKDVPPVLTGDAGRLRQLINNLVGNAIKFTPKGSVALLVTQEHADEQSTTLRFQVSDSGIGIPADKLEHIFEPFTQVDNSTTRRFGGTGLGLAICKRLAKLMGGSIGAESIEGEGSTFWFTATLEKFTGGVPAVPQPAPVTAVDARKRPVGKRIRLLLAEDDPTAQRLVRALLNRYDYDVDVAGNGLEALRALEEAEYDLVLMDCMMPEMNGYEATVAIRDPASVVRRHDIPVIALTGTAMKGDRDRCLAAGMNDHLPKPFALNDLLAKLDLWLQPQGQGHTLPKSDP